MNGEPDDWLVFEPDFELEWELGPDTEIVFTPEPEREGKMSPLHAAQFIGVLAVFMVVARKLEDLVFSPPCMRCGGKLAHKKGCDMAEKDE